MTTVIHPHVHSLNTRPAIADHLNVQHHFSIRTDSETSITSELLAVHRELHLLAAFENDYGMTVEQLLDRRA